LSRHCLLLKIALKKKENPIKILDDIAAVECQFNRSVTEEKRRALVQMIGGKEYSQIICTTNLMYKTSKGRNADADELCQEMYETWRMAGNDEKSNKTSSLDGIEMALSTGTFNGKCNKCHQKGHKAKHCPHKKKGDAGKADSSEKAGASVGSKSDKKCNHCHKPGHVEADCWKKHPTRFQSGRRT
jgi:hypothetical protein